MVHPVMNENSAYACLLHYVHVSGYAALLIVSRIPLHEAMAEILCLNTQVHEKSILLPLMPVMLLGPDQPILTRWLPPVACFSMYPLLKKDDLILAYLALQLLWGSQTWPSGKKKGREGQTGSSTDQAGSSRDHRQEREQKRWRVVLMVGLYVSVGLAAAMHVAPLVLQAPKQYPFIFDAMITSFSFLHILGLAVYMQFQSLAGDRVKVD